MQQSGDRTNKMNRAVFLDRDGVLNKAFTSKGTPYPPSSLAQVEILEGVAESISELKSRNYELIVVTNQPDVARGKTTVAFVNKVHQMITSILDLQHFYVCYHEDSDQCPCRKPKDGLLRMAAKDLHIDLKSSFMVGDRWRDIAAGNSAGCKCYFIDYSYSEPAPEMPFTRVFSLAEATRDIIGAP